MSIDWLELTLPPINLYNAPVVINGDCSVMGAPLSVKQCDRDQNPLSPHLLGEVNASCIRLNVSILAE